MNLNRKQICGMVALVFAAYAAPSMAGFEIIEETAAAPAAVITSGETSLFANAEEAVVVSIPRVVNVGKVKTADLAVSKVTAGEADVAGALKKLTPKGWTGVQRGKPDLTKQVKWSADKNWSEAINEALSQTNLMVELDWTKKKVSIFELPEKVKVAGLAAAKAKAEAVKAATKPTSAPVAKVEVWEIKSGETLKTALTRWMAVSNWQLVWEVQNDFELKAGATFNGNIDDALRKVAESVGVNISMFKGNRVCVVREGSN